MAAESTQDPADRIFADMARIKDALAGSKQDPAHPVYIYEDSAHISYEAFSGSISLLGDFRPKRLLPSKAINWVVDAFGGDDVEGCSTVEYRCISAWHRVFAIPRERLSPEASYAVAGALLKVEDCLVGDKSVCQVALVSADCQKISGEFCEAVPGGRSTSDKPGPILYFIYNEDVGVTAYGFVQEPAMTKNERLNIASKMVLQGPKGLLSDDH